MKFLLDMGVDIRVATWLREQGHDPVHLRDQRVVFRLHNTRTGHVLERLAAVLADCSAILEKGAVVVVEEDRHRIPLLSVGNDGTGHASPRRRDVSWMMQRAPVRRTQ